MQLLLGFNKTDIPAALEPRDFHFRQVFFAIETQIFADIFVRDMITAHISLNETTIADKFMRLSLDQAP